jgi:ABC-type transport system involved in multi-copper enzyme maturation permease subunit
MNTTLPSAHASLPPNRAHAFAGVFRLASARLLLPTRWLAVGGALAVLALLALGSAHGWRSPERFFTWASEFYITFLVPIVAFIGAGGAIRDDLKAGSADYVFTRPIGRSTFVVFRYLAQLVCAQVDFILGLAVVLAAGWYRHVPGVWGAVPALLAGQVLMVAVFSALGFLCGLLTSRYVIVGLGYGLIVEGGIGQIPTQLSRLSMTHQMRETLAGLFGGPGGEGAAQSLVGTTGLVVVFVLVTLTLAAVIFSRRELAGENAEA